MSENYKTFSILIFVGMTLLLSVANWQIDSTLSNINSFSFGIFFENTEEYQQKITHVTLFNSFSILVYTIIIFILNLRSGYEAKIKWSDSIYYLGFILTLVALITAFANVKEGQNDEIIKATIVQNAIALSSTVWAIFLRTTWKLIIGLPQDELSYVTLLTSQYEALGKAVTSTANVFVSEAGKFSALSGQVQAAFDDIKSTIARELGEVSAAFAGYRLEIEKYTARHEDASIALQGVVSNLTNFVDSIDRYSGQMGAVKAAIDSFSEAFESIELHERELIQVVNELNTTVTEASITLSHVSEGQANTETRAARFDATIREKIDVIEVILDKLESATVGMSENLNTIASDSNLKADTDKIRAIMEEFEKRLRNFAKDFERVDGPTDMKNYLRNLLRAIMGRF